MHQDISPTIFYEITKYPIPSNVSVFSWLSGFDLRGNKISNNPENHNKDDFSRERQSPLMSEYIYNINKYWRLYKSIPYVSNIYICNSVSFNSLHPDSDIDLVIVAKPWYIRLARFWSWFMFGVWGIRVNWQQWKQKKFCLSCYVSADSLNLYYISIKPLDILLIYWIVHFVPLYAENSTNINEIYKSNHWITNFLPNISLEPNINIWNQLFTGNNWFKEFIENIIWYSKLSYIYNLIIRSIRLPILKYKTAKLWPKWWGIIHNDKILRFYKDTRKKIYTKYKIATNDIIDDHQDNPRSSTWLFE